MTTAQKLTALRAALRRHNLFAYIIPNTDPHQSEYIAEHWQTLAWFSGFTGSAGNIVVTQDFAGLWTDSRYFLQGETQLAGTGIELMKLNVPHTPEYLEWICKHAPENAKIGVNGQMFSIAGVRNMEKSFKEKKIKVVQAGDLAGELWKDRPSVPATPVYVHELQFAGKSREEKLEAVRTEMKENGVDYHLITSLDDIAWLYNLRGNDVAYNPVGICYTIVGMKKAYIFINEDKIPESLKSTLHEAEIFTYPYNTVAEFLSNIPDESTLLFSPDKTNLWLYESIPQGVKKKEGIHITTPFKSVKNETEVNLIRSTMAKDGVAMVRFLKWLEENVGQITITEVSAATKLREFRAEQEYFAGESFGTIAGYQGHGAIVHYSATEATAYELKPEGIFLLDSGGQYLDGTTDITRTVALGKPDANQQRDFTLVLKGHIALARAIFPEGTRGYQLEGLARQYLWANGMNYGHGTGHGVGFFLNVHEGPQSIGSGATSSKTAILQPGMLTSNEPGVYHKDQYGIRTENLILTVPHSESEDFGKFLCFETVTLCPIDLRLVDENLLSVEEKGWLDQYHQKVYDKISPHLSESEKVWLKEKTMPLGVSQTV
ncbi:MAG: aminopeptidase P family protein [Bacteroidia bacterium]